MQKQINPQYGKWVKNDRHSQKCSVKLALFCLEMKLQEIFLHLLETESLPANWWVFELWEDLHYEKKIKEDSDTEKKAALFLRHQEWCAEIQLRIIRFRW